MKFLAFGCAHGIIHEKIKKAMVKEAPDAVICTGDVADTDNIRDLEFELVKNAKNGITLVDYIKYRIAHQLMAPRSINSMKTVADFLNSLKMPVFMVYGNNDYTKNDLKKTRYKGIEDLLITNVRILINKVIKFNDIYIAGLSGYRKITNKKSGQIIKEITHSEKTFFITHDVPYGKFDMVKLKKSPLLGKHIGDRNINKIIKAAKPAAHICSHMHEYQGIEAIGNTMIINTGYGRIGRCALIETNNGKIKKIRFYK